MNEEEELRDLLGTVDVPPSRIEIDALLRAGRRSAFRRRTVGAAGGAALATAALVAVPSVLTGAGARPAAGPAAVASGGSAEATTTAPAAATVTTAAGKDTDGGCAVAELPVPAGMSGVVPTGVDPTGRYVVGNGTVGQDFRPVRWADGKPEALPVVGQSVQLTAINSAGVAVGLVQDGRQEYVFRYDKGSYRRLRTPPGKWHPYPSPAVNTAGDVVVNVEPSGNSGGRGSIVLLWRAGSTTAVRLPLPTGANAYAITDDGTIVGALYRDGVATAAYAWDQRGRGRRLAAPAGETAAAYAARGGWATGGLWPSQTAARWDLRTGAVTGMDGAEGPGQAVNAAGWVVADGVLLREGGPVELAVPDGGRGVAVAVSDTGLVVGHALSEDGTENLGPRAWRC